LILFSQQENNKIAISVMWAHRIVLHACILSASILHTPDDGFENSRNMSQYKTQVLRKTQDDSSVSFEQQNSEKRVRFVIFRLSVSLELLDSHSTDFHEI
jgi:hypothetical protein